MFFLLRPQMLSFTVHTVVVCVAWLQTGKLRKVSLLWFEDMYKQAWFCDIMVQHATWREKQCYAAPPGGMFQASFLPHPPKSDVTGGAATRPINYGISPYFTCKYSALYWLKTGRNLSFTSEVPWVQHHPSQIQLLTARTCLLRGVVGLVG